MCNRKLTTPPWHRVTLGSVVAAAVLGCGGLAGAEVPRTAFFYGKPVPPELFAHYDRVVIEPEALASPPVGSRAEAFAHVRIGELGGAHELRSEPPSSSFVARNPRGSSGVADLTRAEWHSVVLDRLFEPLWTRGYRGFFLDALDSSQLSALTPEAKRAQARGLEVLLTKLVARHPAVKLVLDRGFDVSGPVRANVVGVAAGSLFSGWDPGARRYVAVPAADRERLLSWLLEVRDKHKVPVTILDYAPRDKPEERRATARKIATLGFDAWVASPGLDELGVGQTEIVPRRVLVVYGGDQRLAEDDAHVVNAAVLERMGYAVDYVSRKDPLPEGKLSARYAGVVTFLAHDDPRRSTAYRAWILERIREGLPVAFVAGFGFAPDPEFLRELGLVAAIGGPSVRAVSAAPWATYETRRLDVGKLLPDVRAVAPGVQSFLRLEDAKGQIGDAIVIGPWGGLVLAPYFNSGGDGDTRRYATDPWTFFARALRLAPMPVLDPTTEGAERILMVHIDGDGFPSRAEIPGTPFAGQVVYDRILSRFKVPTTVSVIEGEVGPEGLHRADSPALERIAQATFRLPHVEIASHSYSHPFDWKRAERWEPFEGKIAHLPVPGYRFDLRRDILGSVDYIDRRLAPPEKRTKVFLWTGDCLPSRDAVAMVDGAGLLNVNGGGATQTVDSPSLMQLQPTMLPMGDGVIQVYAPVENDNIYTHDWLGPFYGFRRVIETLGLTESPRRLTPLSIYYHYFSATKTAGIKALVDVHEWAIRQETHPLYLSQYARRVLSFASASVSRRIDGTWEFKGLGPGRTLRIDPQLGYPDLRRSRGVAGVRDTPPGRYAVLTSDHVEIAFEPERPAVPHIERSNGEVLAFGKDAAGRTRLRVRGNVPLVFAVGGARGPCTLRALDRTIPGAAREGVIFFSLRESDTLEATLECR